MIGRDKNIFIYYILFIFYTFFTLLSENNGHLILISGKTGNELKRREIGRTYFMPQTFKRKDQLFLVYGTGGPASGGSLHLAPLSAIINSGNLVRC